jgi:hypothetical protein
MRSRVLVLIDGRPEGNPPDWCLQPNAKGEMPTCTYAGGQWTQTFDGATVDGTFGDGGTGVGGVFAFFFVLVVLAGVGFTVWRVSTARRMARDAGMSEGDATAMALLTDNGLEATYVASNLRPRPSEAAPTRLPPPEPPRAGADRLRELQGLLDEGLITQEEYAARRQAVLDTL